MSLLDTLYYLSPTEYIDDKLALSASVGACIGVYATGRLFAPKGWNRAWFLTLFSSLVCCGVGVAFLVDFFVQGVPKAASDALSSDPLVSSEQAAFETIALETPASRLCAIFFLSYCVCDAVIGAYEYMDEFDWEAGWLHHAFYAVAIAVLCVRQQTRLFTWCLIEELPTVYLGMQRMRRKQTLPWPFAILYFATRVCYHTWASFRMARASKIAFIVSVALLRKHVEWWGRWWARRESRDATTLGLTVNSKLALMGMMVLIQCATLCLAASTLPVFDESTAGGTPGAGIVSVAALKDAITYWPQYIAIFFLVAYFAKMTLEIAHGASGRGHGACGNARARAARAPRAVARTSGGSDCLRR